MKKWLYIICSILLIFSTTGCSSQSKITNDLHIVTTNFPGYDFSRAIIGNSDNITMLLKPGQESHTFDPTPQDMIMISEADIFIYTGGESDTWVEEMLKSIDNKNLVCIRMMDYVDIYTEEIIEGMQEDEQEEEDHEEEYDEHVWTNPNNAITIIKVIQNQISRLDSEKAATYQENTTTYINEITRIDTTIKDIVSTSPNKELIFGDRFPFRYFVEAYGLKYYAAFSGCSSETEADAKTIAFLISKVKEDQIPVIFHIELSNSNIADTISDETGAQVRLLHSIHNVTETDFLAGKTYIDFMEQNIKNLREALQ